MTGISTNDTTAAPKKNTGPAVHQLNSANDAVGHRSAISHAPGIVTIQAHTTRLAMPQRTADSRRLAPTPTMAPVIVCVVDTGMPACDVKNSVAAAADSAATPPTGWRRVIFEPIVFTIRQPPVSVPSAMAVCADSTTHSGTPDPVGR